jgi:UDP-glucose 4-epimerase
MTNKWVAVTGVSGFVGSHVAHALKSKGYKVLSLSRTAPSTPVDKHITLDISDCLAMERITADLPALICVVHVAASKKQDESAITANVLGTYNVLKHLGKRARNICNISSAPIIGVPEEEPITEQHPVKPLSLYHLTKYQAEMLCELPEFQELNISHLRFASPIGVGMPINVITSVFIANCLSNTPVSINGKGERVMNYIDTRDVANAVVLAVKKPAVSGLFLLNGTSISNIDLARLCVKVTNSQSEIKFTGVPDSQDSHKWIIDGSKAEKELGFVARIPLEQSISDIAESIR